jgi:putative ubiquitin-RnfH superfamily antitoxin RatB of RatAB toxin-antitoxin module
MQVGIAYAESNQQVWLKIELEDGATVRDAIEQSGVLERFPHIDLTRQQVGIFGKMTTLDAKVKDGDRVEIYRAIICDPEKVPRRNTATGAGA